jgi:hypothetical protein
LTGILEGNEPLGRPERRCKDNTSIRVCLKGIKEQGVKMWTGYVTEDRLKLWRIKTNEELDKLIKHTNIIRFVKAQRLNWLSHTERMPEERVAKKINN